MKNRHHTNASIVLVGLMMTALPVTHAQTNTTAKGVGQNELETMHETGVALEAIDNENSTSRQSSVDDANDSTPVVDETLVGEGDPVEGQILMQSEDTILAEDLIGQSVYSSDDERIGEINDLIVNFDGSVDGAVVGVGGFLGIGEKDVAIEMQALELIPQENNDLRLVLLTTREELDAAPGFASKWQQNAAEEASSMRDDMEDSSAFPVPGLVDPVDTTTPADAEVSDGQ